MNTIVLVIVLGAITLIGFYVGARIAGRGSVLTRGERLELKKRRQFMEDLQFQAAEHAMLNDNFAVIVVSNLHNFRKELG